LTKSNSVIYLFLTGLKISLSEGLVSLLNLNLQPGKGQALSTSRIEKSKELCEVI